MSGDNFPMTTALMRTAVAIADATVVADVETEGVQVGPASERRWDVSAMFNPHEHSGPVVDIFEQHIAYGVARGLLALEPGRRWTVRILQGLAS